jgi:hypothetical protein
MLNKYKYRIGIIIIMFLVAAVFIKYRNIEPSAIEKDIIVEATLQLNKTDKNKHKEYLLDINIIKNIESHVIIYPYLEGLGMITYSSEEKEGYFIPSSIGSDNITKRTAVKELRNKNLVGAEDDIELTGFWLPDEAGQYKAQVYLDKLDNFQEIKNPVLACVYRDEILGRELTWSKIIPITIK